MNSASRLLGSVVVCVLGACGSSPTKSAISEPASSAADAPPSLAKPSADPAIAAIDAALASARSAGTWDVGVSGWRTRMPAPPDVLPTANTAYDWVLETDLGTLRFALLKDVAPRHVISTMWLTRAGYFDGLTFHRVIQQFMAQGGCPEGSGRGSPGYRYGGEFAPSAAHDARGTLSMANAGPGTDGSQFFITFAPTPFLNGKHTVFGKLIEGDSVLDAIEAIGTPPRSEGKPKQLVKILHASIVAR